MRQARVCHSSFLAHTVIGKILEAWGPSGFEEHVAKACSAEAAAATDGGAGADVLPGTGGAHGGGGDEASDGTGGVERAQRQHVPLDQAAGVLQLRVAAISTCAQNVDDSYDIIVKHAVDAKVLLIPGSAFLPRGAGWLPPMFAAAHPHQVRHRTCEQHTASPRPP